MLFALLWLHQVVGPTQNNRYLKLTCMEGQVRLAYTILFGDLPAEDERRRMDANGDGAITPEETRAWGAALARTVSSRGAISIDSRPVALAFSTVEVGLGSERGVHPVPFSVDLIVLLPTGADREHTVTIDDR